MIDDGFNTHFFMFGKESEHLSVHRENREKERRNWKANVARRGEERGVINHSLVTAAAEETREVNSFRLSPSSSSTFQRSHNLVAAAHSQCTSVRVCESDGAVLLPDPSPSTHPILSDRPTLTLTARCPSLSFVLPVTVSQSNSTAVMRIDSKDWGHSFTGLQRVIHLSGMRGNPSIFSFTQALNISEGERRDHKSAAQ